MNTNSSKRHQVVSSGNKTDIKKIKMDKAHQTSCSEVNETCRAFLMFCQDNAQKCILHSMNCSADIGN